MIANLVGNKKCHVFSPELVNSSIRFESGMRRPHTFAAVDGRHEHFSRTRILGLYPTASLLIAELCSGFCTDVRASDGGRKKSDSQYRVMFDRSRVLNDLEKWQNGYCANLEV